MSKYNAPVERLIGRYEDRGKPGFTKLGLPRKKLGRPRDVNKDLPLEKQREIYLEMHRKGIPLTIEQTRLCIWDPETQDKPLSKMAVQKIEEKALAKLKVKLAELGIKNLDDVFGPRREVAEVAEA
jgi:hypothetical protein